MLHGTARSPAIGLAMKVAKQSWRKAASRIRRLKKNTSSARRIGSPWARFNSIDLARAAFLQDAVDFQTLRLGEIIDVVDDAAVFVHRRQGVGLLARRPPPAAPHGRMTGWFGSMFARGQEEFHLGRDHGRPAWAA